MLRQPIPTPRYLKIRIDSIPIARTWRACSALPAMAAAPRSNAPSLTTAWGGGQLRIIDHAVLLMSAAGSAQPVDKRPIFVAGAATASFACFAALAYGARLLQPRFARPAAWRILDALAAITMRHRCPCCDLKPDRG